MLQRSAGVLLHPTSLPGPFGIGDLGPAAESFLDWAQAAGQRYWQILPLGPVGATGSPYSSPSAFAGNPLLISPLRLVAEGLLTDNDLPAAEAACQRVDFPQVLRTKEALLRRAWERFRECPDKALKAELTSFCGASKQADWLDDWALFSALRCRYGLQPWWSWEEGLAQRSRGALAAAREELREEVAYHRFVQFLFDRQWRHLRRQAKKRGILLYGDLPMYGALDSADVWARQDLFELGEDLRPVAVAGVPPDDFSSTGQLWGNPLYRWDRMAEEGFQWWIDRVAGSLGRVDLLRLDHFRGFEAYWRVLAGESTAVRGEWRSGPGRALFDALRRALGGLPLVAEDLGMITPEVEALRRDLDLPGMAILQFSFGEEAHGHRPDHTGQDRVIYTGTHDNETTAGWFANLDEETKGRVLASCGAVSATEIPWALIRWVYSSAARLAVVPAQDYLGLGNEARMNIPGLAGGNWSWRLRPGALTPRLGQRLLQLTEESGRRGVV